MEDLTEQKKRPPRYIIDEPAPVDFFKSHSALVKAILDSLKFNPRIHSIGLLGSWGSGKSTIVADLQKLLVGSDGPKHHAFFGYDAWVHQGDPLRRSFLEELIASLSAEGVCTRAHWEKDLRNLTGRSETSRSTNIPKFTVAAKLLFVSILPLPIALSFIDFDLIDKAFGKTPNPMASTILYWAILTALLPMFMTAALYLCTRPWRKFSNREEAFWTAAPDILSLIVTQTAQSSTTRTLKSIDPTSLEFQIAFRKILSAIHPLRLIVVIDNIDRLNELDSLEVWSVMRGLLTNKSLFATDGADVVDPIVILPFDPDAMELKSLKEDVLPGKKMAEDLIAKSFDLVFRVPKPVQSDWKDYFDSQLRYVFGDTVKARDIFWVSKYFEHHLQVDCDNIVTPRLINRFINEIASFGAQQLETFQISTIAFYLARKSEIEKSILSFLHETGEIEGLDLDWEQAVVAMYYGVTRDTSAHVLLSGPLAESVSSCDFDRFAAYSERRGFARVLASYLNDASQLENGRYDLTPLLELARLCDSDKNATVISNVIWDLLFERILKADHSQIPTNDFVESVEALIKHLAKPDRARFVEAMGLATITQFYREPDEQKHVELARCALRLVAIKRPSQGPIFKVGGSALKAVQFLAANKNAEPVLSSTEVTQSWADIVKYVEQSISDETKTLFVSEFVAQIRDLDVADRFLKGSRETAYKQIVEITTGILRDDDIDMPVLHSALKVIGILSASPAATPALHALLSENILERIFDAQAEAAEEDTLAQIAALAAMNPNEVQESLASKILAVTDQDDEFVLMIFDAILIFNSGSYVPKVVDLLATETTIQPLAPAIMNAGIHRGTLGEKLLVAPIFRSFSALTSSMGRDSRTTLVRQLTRWSDFSTELQKQSSDALFFEVLGHLPSEQADVEAFKRFEDYNTEKWGSAILEGTENWLLFVRHKDSFKPGLLDKLGLADGLIHAGEKLSLDFAVTTMRRWLTALEALGKPQREIAVRELASAAVNQSNSALFLALTDIGGFNLAKQSMVDLENFSEKLFADLTRQKGGRTWLKENCSWLNKGSAKAKNLMRSRLFDVIKSKNSERREWANRMLSLLKE